MFALTSGQFYALNMVCAAGLLVMSCLKGMERLVRSQRDEHGRHGHELLEREREDNVVGFDAICFGERLGMGYNDDHFERGEKDIELRLQRVSLALERRSLGYM